MTLATHVDDDLEVRSPALRGNMQGPVDEIFTKFSDLKLHDACTNI